MDKAAMEKLRAQADGCDLYQCIDCSAYWWHVGDFACRECGSKRAEPFVVAALGPPHPKDSL
jgi:hypothetical protein